MFSMECDSLNNAYDSYIIEYIFNFNVKTEYEMDFIIVQNLYSDYVTRFSRFLTLTLRNVTPVNKNLKNRLSYQNISF